MGNETTVHTDYGAAALTLREQERLGQELHDTLGPQLTAISMLAASLHERLRCRGTDETALAAKLLARIEQTKAEARALAKGLLPVEYDSEGLMSALTDLAEQTEETHGIACRFECTEIVNVRDNFMATRLYRIAKEAVHNAVKHAQPEEIVIHLANEGKAILQIRDDGVGFVGVRKDHGNGIKMMRHRCKLVGGKFEIGPGRDGGTVVTCSIR